MLGLFKRVPPPIGVRGERVAVRFLKRRGYRILARNLRNRFGEIDLIVQPRGEPTIVIVEVKAGTGGRHRPEVHVTPHQQRKLVALAAQAVRRHRLHGRPIRFDVIAVDFIDDQKPAVRHYVGAFQSQV